MNRVVCSVSFFILCFASFTARSDEGMWLPMLLNETVFHDMRNEGLKLTAEDIYSTNNSSLKDGVILFGGGCTGELISDQGLMITNYHCGRSQVQSHSSIEKDYMKNGYWAMKKSEEFHCPGLTVTFIVRMDDVTPLVLKGIEDGMTESQRQTIVDANSLGITGKITGDGYFNAVVRSFYYGNQYILIVSQTFRDIRLTGAPPQSIGDFGGDADNWIWPRHNADFSLFRIYADSSNNPSDFSEGNIPYKPRHFFPISTRGVKENDFAMVYGFPGRTTEYLPSYAVDLTQSIADPERVLIRDARLKIWWKAMQENDTMRLHYSSKYYGLSNSWKKWQGEILGLQRVDAVNKKQMEEDTFKHRIENNPAWKKKYAQLLPELKTGYDSLRRWQKLFDYYTEALKAPEIFIVATAIRPLAEAAMADTAGPETLHRHAQKIKKQLEIFFRNYDAQSDRKITAEMFRLSIASIGVSQMPSSLKATFTRQKITEEHFVTHMLDHSFLDDRQRLFKFLDDFKKGSEKKLFRDEIYVFGNDIDQYAGHFIIPGFQKWSNHINLLQREYMKAQMEVFPGKRFYPDANLSLRLAYGKVTGYNPKDGVKLSYFTTSDGIEQKYIPGDEYYDTPENLIELFQKKDYGNYTDNDGTLHTCFITSSHTTGGNSGSPVLDASGNLIGTNFDRCWEGTMSDLYYDSSLCRNITLDVRYMLFIIDQYAGAGYLLNEMKLVK